MMTTMPNTLAKPHLHSAESSIDDQCPRSTRTEPVHGHGTTCLLNTNENLYLLDVVHHLTALKTFQAIMTLDITKNMQVPTPNDHMLTLESLLTFSVLGKLAILEMDLLVTPLRQRMDAWNARTT